MRRLVALLVAAAIALSACTGSDAVDQTSNSDYKFTSGTGLGKVITEADRKKAPPLPGVLLDGKKTVVAGGHGKVVVLNFWASWCPPCRVELPQFDTLSRRLASQGVHFVGVNTKDDKGNAESFVKTNDISFPTLYDEQGETALRLGNIPSAGLPFTVLLDKRGDVAGVYVERLTPADVQRSIDTLLAEH